MSARTYKDDDVPIQTVDQQKVATDVTFPAGRRVRPSIEAFEDGAQKDGPTSSTSTPQLSPDSCRQSKRLYRFSWPLLGLPQVIGRLHPDLVQVKAGQASLVDR